MDKKMFGNILLQKEQMICARFLVDLEHNLRKCSVLQKRINSKKWAYRKLVIFNNDLSRCQVQRFIF